MSPCTVVMNLQFTIVAIEVEKGWHILRDVPIKSCVMANLLSSIMLSPYSALPMFMTSARRLATFLADSIPRSSLFESSFLNAMLEAPI